VFGRRAALAASEAVMRAIRPEPAQPLADLAGPPLQSLREAMSAHAGVEREAAGLTQLTALIDRLEQRCGPRAALTAARFVAASALARQDSRGAHYRSDAPANAEAGRAEPGRHTRLSLSDLNRSAAADSRAA